MLRLQFEDIIMVCQYPSPLVLLVHFRCFVTKLTCKIAYKHKVCAEAARLPLQVDVPFVIVVVALDGDFMTDTDISR